MARFKPRFLSLGGDSVGPDNSPLLSCTLQKAQQHLQPPGTKDRHQYPSILTTKNLSRYCQMTPGGRRGQYLLCLRTISNRDIALAQRKPTRRGDSRKQETTAVTLARAGEDLDQRGSRGLAERGGQIPNTVSTPRDNPETTTDRRDGYGSLDLSKSTFSHQDLQEGRCPGKDFRRKAMRRPPATCSPFKVTQQMPVTIS